MTPPITARRVALAGLTVVVLMLVYLIGATRSTGAPGAASTRAVMTSSTQPSTQAATQAATQSGAIPGVGGAGITVSGTAVVAGAPDTLRLDLSVVASAPSVSEALTKANLSADAVQRSLVHDGVTKKDLQTSGLNIAPSYDYSSSGTPRLKGYEVSESVTARLRDLGRAGGAIGRAVDVGGNAVRVNGISLDLEDTGMLVSRARDRAFADAKAKAEQYASAAGRSLGDVVSIAENVASPSPVPMVYSQTASSAAKSADVPIQPGSQDVRVTATVVFAMR